MIIQLTADQMKQVVDAAEAAFPAEACGLLVGRGKGQVVRVTRVVPAVNLLAATPDRFEIDPAVRIGLEKELRDTKDRIIGHFHSHPDGSTEPSAQDRAMAFEPDLVWMITGVTGAQAIQTQAHRIDPKRNDFRHVVIRITRQGSESSAPPQ